MSETSPTPAADTLPGGSREEVRQRYLAAFAASQPGGPLPDLDAFLTGLPEPDRSQLRSELLGVVDPRAATTEEAPRNAHPVKSESPPASASTAGTVEALPPAADEGRTVEHVPADPQGTVDHIPTVPEAHRQESGAGTRRPEPPMPATVAGYEVLRLLGRTPMNLMNFSRRCRLAAASDIVAT